MEKLFKTRYFCHRNVVDKVALGKSMNILYKTVDFGFCCLVNKETT